MGLQSKLNGLNSSLSKRLPSLIILLLALTILLLLWQQSKFEEAQKDEIKILQKQVEEQDKTIRQLTSSITGLDKPTVKNLYVSVGDLNEKVSNIESDVGHVKTYARDVGFEVESLKSDFSERLTFLESANSSNRIEGLEAKSLLLENEVIGLKLLVSN